MSSEAAAAQPGGAVRWATVGLGGLLLLAGMFLLFAGRHLTFFYDEWTFIEVRRGSQLAAFLDPHNGHLVVFPVIIYKLLFALVGLHHYWPYRLVATVLHLVCGGLLYILVRRRLGPWVALVPVTMLLFLGSAWQDLLWPFQMGWFMSVAGGLGALALIERPRERGDVYATLLLILSVGSSAIGLAFLVACFALLLIRRDAWRRFSVVLVPALLFAVWYLGWGASQTITSDAVLGAPGYIATAGAGATAGLVGLDPSWGDALAVAVLALLAVGLRTRPNITPPHLLIAAGVGALTFWGLAAVARADFAEPLASRYLYIGGVFILIAASEAWGRRRITPGWTAVLGVLLIGALVGNLNMLRAGERGLRSADDAVRAGLAVTDLARNLVAPSFVPEPGDAPMIQADGYFAAERSLGTPALSLSELERAPESVREQADAVLQAAERLRAVPGAPPSAAAPPPTEALYGARVTVRHGCDIVTPTAALSSLDVRAQPGGAVAVHSSGATASLYLRRFASVFTGAPIAHVPAGASSTVTLPRDAGPQIPWHAQIVSPRPVRVCTT